MTRFWRRITAVFMTVLLAGNLCACVSVSYIPGPTGTQTASPKLDYELDLNPEDTVPALYEGETSLPVNEKKYFFSQLYGEELTFYSRIYTGLMNFEEKIDLADCGAGMSFDRAKELVQAVFDDCPELYMCTGDYVLRGTGGVSEAEFVYQMSRESYISAAAEISALVGGWREKFSGLSDYEKALGVYTAIADICEYSDDNEFGDTAYGALCRGRALCQGYSKALQLALQNLDIVCIFVSSREMAHGWNVAELDGAFYQLDLTWDDSGGAGTCVYFNMSDELAEKLGHVYDKNEAWVYPECSSLELNYYVKNGIMVLKDADVKETFFAKLSELRSNGSGGRLTLMFEEKEQLAELSINQREWVTEWNRDKYLTVSYTRIIPEDNDYVYIADFCFEQ